LINYRLFLPFDFQIQKARWLNQEGPKEETRARAETPAEGAQILSDAGKAACFIHRRRKSRRHSNKQQGALTETLVQDRCTMMDKNDFL
jgi:hypothetical protein